MREVYGTDMRSPGRSDIQLYRRYAGMASTSSTPPDVTGTPCAYKRMMLAQQSAFAVDNTLQVTTPFVAKSALDVYVGYFLKGRRGRVTPSPRDTDLYARYASR